MAQGMKCPRGHTRVWRKGYVPLRTGLKARYVCFTCGKTFYAPGTPDDRPTSKYATSVCPSVE